MGLFDFLRKPEQPNIDAVIQEAVKTELAKTLNWASFFSGGGDLSTISSDKNSYKNVASVYKAIKAIIDNAPQAKVVFLNSSGEMVESQPLQERFKEPSLGKSWNDFIGEIAGFYEIYGEVFLLIIEETIGDATGSRLPALMVVDPSAVTEKVDAGVLQGWVINQKQYLPEQVIQVKDFNPFNPWRGLSPLQPISKEISIDSSTMMFNDAFFKNDATPHLVLEAEKGLTDVQRKQIEAWWKSKHQGAKKAGTMAILEGGMKARTIAPTHKDMDFIEQKKMMREEILGEYRCPKALFNITDTLNYATFNGQMKVFWLYTIVPMLRKVEDAINYGYMRKYAKGITFSFDFRNVPAFAEDFNQKVISAKTLFDMGFTRNEINEEMEFGFEQQPWGDEWWVGAGMSPASSWSMEDEPAPKEEPAPAKSAIDIAIDKAFPQSVKKQALLRSFLKKQEVIEKKFYRKLKRYFFDYRASLLALPDMNLANKDLTMNLEQMDDKLKKMLEPLYREAIDGGVDGAKDDVGNEKSIEQEVKNRLEAFLQFQLTNITGINKTVRKQLLAKIDSAMAEGVISGGTMTEIASGVRDVIRDYFNYDVGYKSKLIARTETVGAMNGAKMEYYDEVGVEKKEWTTANDEVVRESHRECQSVGAIPLNETFPNGLMYAGDQSTGDASEVCNCRCTVVASIVGRD